MTRVISTDVAIGSQKGSHKDEIAFVNSFQAGFSHIYLLGMGLTIGGLFTGWTRSMAAGFFGGLAAMLLCSTLYCTIAFCQAEMISIVAFSGGSYGFARASLGPLWGYLAGCSEWIQNNFYTITVVMDMGETITYAFQTPNHYEPLWFFLFYCAIVCWHTAGGRYFWYVMCGCAMLSMMLLLIYLLGCMIGDTAMYSYRFNHRGESQTWANGSSFMKALVLPVGIYIGIETMCISAAKMANGRDIIPKAQVGVFLTTFVLAIWLLFVFVAESNLEDWQEVIHENYFLDFGFRRVLNIPLRYASLLSIIPNYSISLGFIFASTHLTQAMSLSGLFPPFFQNGYGKRKIPIRSLLACSTLQYVVLMIGWLFTEIPPFYNIVVTGLCCNFMYQMMAFIVFRYRYESMERKFVSPLGISGAVLGFVIALLVLISALGFQSNSFQTVVTYFTYIAIMTIYYFTVAKSNQFFSPEEQRKFMKAYIVNANKKKKLSKIDSLMMDIKYYMSCQWLLHLRSNFFDRATSISSASKQSKSTTSAPTKLSKIVSVRRRQLVMNLFIVVLKWN